MADLPAMKFLNARDWRSFLTAIQCSVSDAKMVEALRSSPAWFLDGAARTSNWLLSSGLLRPRRYLEP